MIVGGYTVKNKLHVNSLLMKILCTVVGGIICVTIAISVIVIHISKDIFIDTFGQSQEKVFNQIEENLYDFHGDIVQITNAVDASWSFRLYLNSQKEQESQMAFRTIYQMKKHLATAIPSNIQDVSVLVVGFSGTSFLNSDELITTPVKDIQNSVITKKALESPDAIQYHYLDHGFTSTTKATPVIIATKVLNYVESRTPYGVVYITIKEKDFEKFYDHFTSDSSEIIIMNDENVTISSNKKDMLGNPEARLNQYANEMIAKNQTRTVTELNRNKVTILTKPLPYYNSNLCAVIDNSKALKEMYNVPLLSLICFFIAFVVLMILFFLIQKTIKPLSLLTKKMSKVRNGEFDQYVEITGTEEIRQLSMTFNYMLDDLNNYVNQLMEVQKEKRTAEIHALQMQINPHYVFNTLTSIKWLIWQGDADKSVKVIDAFIMLLRNTISNTDEFITVEQELENLKNYVLINNTRYGDNVVVEYYVQYDCEKYLLPKLILQPFIENSFFHAFPMDRKGEIQVFLKEVGDNIQFEIIDNGIGMSETQLEAQRYKSEEKTEHFTGIGINNVDDRIKLIYGMDYGIKIHSEVNKGTTVMIRLPKKEH